MSQPGDYGGGKYTRISNMHVEELTRDADEIAALVLDPGYYLTRAGFAGEDTPKSVVPTFYGVSEDHPEPRFGDNAILNPYLQLDLRNPFNSDGIVEDFDTAAKLWEYSIVTRLIGNAKDKSSIRGSTHSNGTNGEADGDVIMEDAEEAERPLGENPLLMTEPSWNPVKNREKTFEIAMESWGCPAFFLAREPVMQA